MTDNSERNHVPLASNTSADLPLRMRACATKPRYVGETRDLFIEGAAEIELLTRELKVQKAVNDLAYIPHRNLVESRDGLQKRYDKVEAERDRLRAALERCRLASGLAKAEIIDAALSGEPAPKRAYYETHHEPPHCPTCDCGSAHETTAKPTDSELYSSSELFRHIWVCPIGWIGDRLIYGPGYTSADMKPWLVKLRRLVGFEHPEGTPLEQPEKASDPQKATGEA